MSRRFRGRRRSSGGRSFFSLPTDTNRRVYECRGTGSRVGHAPHDDICLIRHAQPDLRSVQVPAVGGIDPAAVAAVVRRADEVSL